jgi:hypothetical protein
MRPGDFVSIGPDNVRPLHRGHRRGESRLTYCSRRFRNRRDTSLEMLAKFWKRESLAGRSPIRGRLLPAAPEISGSAVRVYVGAVLFSAAVAGRSELCLRYVLT